MSAFIDLMNEMRSHHKNMLGERTRRRFKPSSKELSDIFYSDYDAVLSESEKDSLEGLKYTSQTMGSDTAQGINDKITVSTGELKESGGTQKDIDDFRSKMERQRLEAKENASKNIDKVYDEAIKLGEENPNMQGAISSLMDVVGNLFNDLVSKIVDYVVGIVKSIREWLTRAWESIRSFFGGVTSWISNWF